MTIDQLINTAVFSQDGQQKEEARAEIRKLAKSQGIFPASIFPLYQAFGKKEVSGFTVPAVNIRTLTYDTARIIFSLMKKHHIGTVIFEIARSEMDYTDQRPDEYAVSVLAAAIKENYSGPIFLQGDHFQLSKRRFTENQESEIQKIRDLATEAIQAQFFNIDIDASTLVDLEKPILSEQQKTNFEVTATLTKHIRSLEPKGTTIAIGGEIGHIGGKNSTTADFGAFMEGYLALLDIPGISKVSVQTGTSHGGVPLPDGTMADIKLDFSVLANVGKVAREKYGLGGAVQHGASTLPSELFGEFVKAETLEIHLATGFQNIVYDTMPTSLRKEMHQWTKDNCQKEREEGWSDEQFVYKMRKIALGPFKQKLWELTNEDKAPIREKLRDQFAFLFEKLNVFDTRSVVDRYISIV
ncbi:MAG: class II fructose-bisphosphate aldolase [Candidatus Levybacteria bacterium]|nr:class II fructose-bisphosphate aldolase [Candidatus Levybacteria bacterium]